MGCVYVSDAVRLRNYNYKIDTDTHRNGKNENIAKITNSTKIKRSVKMKYIEV